jgi:integrase
MSLPKLENNSGGIRIRIQVDGKRYVFSPVKNGKYGDRAHMRHAEFVIRQIDLDLEKGDFDHTLERYKPKSNKKNTAKNNKKEKPNPTLIDLWKKFFEYKSRLGLAKVSLELDYKRRVGNVLPLLPSTSLDSALEIRDWLLEHKPPKQARKILMRLSECCEWAVGSNLIETNVFKQISTEVSRNVRRTQEHEEPDPFTKEERDRIIEAFKNSKTYSKYAPLVTFLFFVGCRPSEAAGLKWSDVSEDSITFRNSYVQRKDTKRLKTQASRHILINQKVKEALEEQRRLTGSRPYVFYSSRGARLNWDSFNSNAWKNVLAELPDIRYRNPYQMRHCCITLLMRSGESLTDIAKYCGNSPQTILSEYAGVTRDYVPPII